MARGKQSLGELEKTCQRPNHPGFVGATCSHCGATVNTLFGICFHCPLCNAHNSPPRMREPLHETPAGGNSLAEIDLAENFTYRDRIWSKLPRSQREAILAEALGGIYLKLSALTDKAYLEIENALDAEEFDIFLRLLLQTAESAK